MTGSTSSERWQLFRLLGEPARLRLLALADREELSLGELASLLVESLPNVSRHAAPLRQAGLLSERRLGTRTFVRMAGPRADALIEDALSVGRALCEQDGVFARIAEVVRQRDARTRELLGEAAARALPWPVSSELPLFLMALRELVPARELAVDVCPGDGALLDVLCPIFSRVLLLEPAAAAPSVAEQRAAARGYLNVEVLKAGPADVLTRATLGAGADLVVAAYLAARSVERPSAVTLTRLLGPRGRLVVLEANSQVEWSLAPSQLGPDGLEQLRAQRLASPSALGAEAGSEWRVWSGVRSRTPREPGRP